MIKTVALSFMLLAGNSVAADYTPPQTTQNNNPVNNTTPSSENPPVAAKEAETDASCSRASHKAHDHCPGPQGNFRHDGRVWRNGKIIKE